MVQHLLPEARAARAAGRDPTFWLRGLVKSELTGFDIQGGTEVWCLRFDDHGNPASRMLCPTWAAAIADNCSTLAFGGFLRAFTDGSGGAGSADRRVRTCGWGVVFMRSHFVAGLAFCGELPGCCELAAAHFALTFALAFGAAGSS